MGPLLLEDRVVQAFQKKKCQQVQGFQVILALLLNLEVLQALYVPSRQHIQVCLVFQVNLGFQVYQVRSSLLDLVVQVDQPDRGVQCRSFQAFLVGQVGRGRQVHLGNLEYQIHQQQLKIRYKYNII